MIKRLTNGDYMKRFTAMTLEEQSAFKEEVISWLETQAPLLAKRQYDQQSAFQNALQCSVNWNDGECAAWEKGAVLLTALNGMSDTWLPDAIYIKAAKRTIKKMETCLSDVPRFSVASAEEQQKEEQAKPEPPSFEESQGEQKTQKPKKAEAAPTKEQPAVKQTSVSAPAGRPKHIDQYAHLLPAKTQEKAAQVKQILRDLDAARENARILMNDKSANADDIARWAKMATKLDDTLRSIYKEIDEEWDKLVKSGKVVVDDIGNVRVIEESPAEEKPTEEKPSAKAKKPAAKKAKKTSKRK